jgi:hypothetical protein
MYEGEDANTIDLLYETTTTEDNGVKVIVPVKFEDRYDFHKKIKEQLAYFESVYFDVSGVGADIKNDFLIYRHELFQFSELSTDNLMHICLDNVYYPIDFQKLGISSIYIPIGLRFSLTDGLFPTPNRESLRYTPEAKKTIIDKITEISNYFVTKYNDSIQDTDDIQQIFNYYSTKKRFIEMSSSNFEIADLEKFSTIKFKTPTHNKLKLLDLARLYTVREYILSEYESKFSINNARVSQSKSFWSKRLTASKTFCESYYLMDINVGSNKKLYLKSILNPSNNYHIIKKVSSISLFGNNNTYDNYFTILELKKHPRKNWRGIIKEFQLIRDEFINNTINLDELEIPKEWLESRRKQPLKISSDGKRVMKLKGEIIVKEATARDNYSYDKNCKFVSQTYQLETFHKLKSLFVYTSHDNASKLDPLFGMFNKQKVRFITLSSREMLVVEKVNIHNLIPLEKFMEQKDKPFKRVVTAYLINQLIENKKNVFENRRFLETIHTSLFDKINTLRNYHHTNYVYASKEIYSTIVPIAEEHNLFDIPMYQEYLDVKKTLDKLYFINNLLGAATYGRTFEKEIIDLMKYQKEKVNINQYNSPVQEIV